MSVTYSLKAFANQYALSVEQLFDRSWLLYDITKLRICHRGHPITFILDGNPIPEFFEYRKPGVNGYGVRGTFLEHIDELTVTERDINEWYAKAESTREYRATNPYRPGDLCTYGNSFFETFLSTLKSPKGLLCWHITNRFNMIEDEKNSVVVEAKPGIFDFLKKKLFA